MRARRWCWPGGSLAHGPSGGRTRRSDQKRGAVVRWPSTWALRDLPEALIEELLEFAKHRSPTESSDRESSRLRFQTQPRRIVLKEPHNMLRKLSPILCDPECFAR